MTARASGRRSRIAGSVGLTGFNFSGEFATDYTVQSLHPFVTKSNNSATPVSRLFLVLLDTEFAYDPLLANQQQLPTDVHARLTLTLRSGTQ